MQGAPQEQSQWSQRVKQVILEVIQHDFAKQFFNQPSGGGSIDIGGTRRPTCFVQILQKLMDSGYSSPAEVHADIQGIWALCLETHPPGSPQVQACDRLSHLVNLLWRHCGLDAWQALPMAPAGATTAQSQQQQLVLGPQPSLLGQQVAAREHLQQQQPQLVLGPQPSLLGQQVAQREQQRKQQQEQQREQLREQQQPQLVLGPQPSLLGQQVAQREQQQLVLGPQPSLLGQQVALLGQQQQQQPSLVSLTCGQQGSALLSPTASMHLQQQNGGLLAFSGQWPTPLSPPASAQQQQQQQGPVGQGLLGFIQKEQRGQAHGLGHGVQRRGSLSPGLAQDRLAMAHMDQADQQVALMQQQQRWGQLAAAAGAGAGAGAGGSGAGGGSAQPPQVQLDQLVLLHQQQARQLEMLATAQRRQQQEMHEREERRLALLASAREGGESSSDPLQPQPQLSLAEQQQQMLEAMRAQRLPPASLHQQPPMLPLQAAAPPQQPQLPPAAAMPLPPGAGSSSSGGGGNSLAEQQQQMLAAMLQQQQHHHQQQQHGGAAGAVAAPLQHPSPGGSGSAAAAAATAEEHERQRQQLAQLKQSMLLMLNQRRQQELLLQQQQAMLLQPGGSGGGGDSSAKLPQGLPPLQQQHLQLQPQLMAGQMGVDAAQPLSPGASLAGADPGQYSQQQQQQQRRPARQRPARVAQIGAAVKEAMAAQPQTGPACDSLLRQGHPLHRCLWVVQRLMQLEDAEPFSEPVDAEALGIPDYHQVVKHPMDFGTILARLAPGLTEGWGMVFYRGTDEVLADVLRVFANCRLYNATGSHITEMCSRVEAAFFGLWQEAGLGTAATAASSPPSAPAAAPRALQQQREQGKPGQASAAHSSGALAAGALRRQSSKQSSRKQGAVGSGGGGSGGAAGGNSKRQRTASDAAAAPAASAPAATATASAAAAAAAAAEPLRLEEQQQQLEQLGQQLMEHQHQEDEQQQVEEEGLELQRLLSTGGSLPVGAIAAGLLTSASPAPLAFWEESPPDGTAAGGPAGRAGSAAALLDADAGIERGSGGGSGGTAGLPLADGAERAAAARVDPFALHWEAAGLSTLHALGAADPAASALLHPRRGAAAAAGAAAAVGGAASQSLLHHQRSLGTAASGLPSQPSLALSQQPSVGAATLGQPSSQGRLSVPSAGQPSLLGGQPSGRFPSPPLLSGLAAATACVTAEQLQQEQRVLAEWQLVQQERQLALRAIAAAEQAAQELAAARQELKTAQSAEAAEEQRKEQAWKAGAAAAGGGDMPSPGSLTALAESRRQARFAEFFKLGAQLFSSPYTRNGTCQPAIAELPADADADADTAAANVGGPAAVGEAAAAPPGDCQCAANGPRQAAVPTQLAVAVPAVPEEAAEGAQPQPRCCSPEGCGHAPANDTCPGSEQQAPGALPAAKPPPASGRGAPKPPPPATSSAAPSGPCPTQQWLPVGCRWL